MGYRVIVVRCELRHKERTELFRRFNDENDPSQVLVTSISLSRGVNLHGACHTAMVIDHDASLPDLLQTACRVNRIGQEHKQEVLVISLNRSYDQHQLARALRKYSPQFYAEHLQFEEKSPTFFRYLKYCVIIKQTMGWATVP